MLNWHMWSDIWKSHLNSSMPLESIITSVKDVHGVIWPLRQLDLGCCMGTRGRLTLRSDASGVWEPAGPAGHIGLNASQMRDEFTSIKLKHSLCLQKTVGVSQLGRFDQWPSEYWIDWRGFYIPSYTRWQLTQPWYLTLCQWILYPLDNIDWWKSLSGT